MPFAFAKSLFSSKSLKRHGTSAKDAPRPKRQSLVAKKQSVMQETALMIDPFAPPPPPLSPSLFVDKPQPDTTEELSPVIIIEQDHDDTPNSLNRALTLPLPSRGPSKPTSSPNLRPSDHDLAPPPPPKSSLNKVCSEVAVDWQYHEYEHDYEYGYEYDDEHNQTSSAPPPSSEPYETLITPQPTFQFFAKRTQSEV
ncbi:hypothetical protein MD484_g5669, partial [Candolleomyces efflorescens]